MLRSHVCCTHSFSLTTELKNISIQEKFDAMVVGKHLFSLCSFFFSPRSFGFPPFPPEYMAAVGAEMLQELYLMPIFCVQNLKNEQCLEFIPDASTTSSFHWWY